LFVAGDYAGCLSHLEALNQKSPQQAPAAVVLASWFFEAQQPAQARQVLEQAVVKSPLDPKLYLAFGELAIREGRLTDAELQFSRALELASGETDDATHLRRSAIQCRQGLSLVAEARGDWGSVQAHLAAALQADADRADLRQRLGRACYHLGLADEAVIQLDQAAQIDETIEPASIAMARLLTEDNKFEEAETSLQKGIAASPNDGRIRFAFASWLLDRDRPSEALQQLNAVEASDRESRDWRLLAGLIARRQRDYARAEAILDELYRDDPREFQILNQLALVLAEHPESEKKLRALQLAEVSCRLFPDLSAAQATLGCVLHRLNRLPEAEAAFSAAATGGAMNSDAAYHLACVLAAREKRTEAVQVLRAAIEASGPFYFRAEREQLLAQLSEAK
jgi:tetratricopeptide (TPR) repeat protein